MKDIRDKQRLRGIEALSDEELLTLLLEDADMAASLLGECGSLASIASTPQARLRMIAGLGAKRSELISVAAEIGKRISHCNNNTPNTITSSDDVVAYMAPLLKELKHEECWAIYLTNSNRIIERYRISQGGIQATTVDQRIVV